MQKKNYIEHERRKRNFAKRRTISPGQLQDRLKFELHIENTTSKRDNERDDNK